MLAYAGDCWRMLTYADYAGGRGDGAGRGVRAAGAARVSARCRRGVRSHYAGKQPVKLVKLKVSR